MSTRDFRQLLDVQAREGRFLCVGLDPDISKFPTPVDGSTAREKIVSFNTQIIDATKDVVSSFKPNTAFYEAYGDEGWAALKDTIDYIVDQAPGVSVILDAKRADIGNTNSGYVTAAFDWLRADAITVHPYLGSEALEPFIARKEKGIFVLCRTSNHGAAEFQDLKIDGIPLYQHVAKTVAAAWNTNRNCGLVVGATYPEEMKAVRAIAPDLPILIPGVGAQGGNLEKSVRAGRDSYGKGVVISVTRAVLYASSGTDFPNAARKMAKEYDGAIRSALLESTASE